MSAKAVIYARYSSHNQREESIEDQVRVCEAAAREEGDEVVAVFFDRAASGTNDRRPGFLGLIELSRRKEWQRVWTYKTDRFARNRYDAAVYKRQLKKCGVCVKCAAEPIPDGPVGVLMESVLEGMAEYYSANLGENVARGLNGNALNCHPNGVSVFGYDIAGARIDDHGKYHPGDHYEINERDSEAVRTVFSLRRRGWTLGGIASRLDELGYKTKQGRTIKTHYVRRILQDPRYMGVYWHGGVCVVGGMPSIVSETEWMAAQTEAVRHKLRRKKHRKHVFVRPGMEFGELEVKEAARTARHHTRWVCKCHACGGTKVEWATRLTSGKATHCGCLSQDSRERDGLGRFA